MKTLAKLASEKRVNAPILNTILVKDGMAYSTNMEQYIAYACSDIAPGLYCGKGFDKVQIAYPDKDCSESDFPGDDIIKLGQLIISFTVKRTDLEYIAPAMSKEETRYYLNGAVFDNRGVTATDGYILLHAPLNYGDLVHDDFSRIMPRATVDMLISIMEEEKEAACTIELYNLGFVVHCGKYKVRSKNIDGTFPDYMRVIPGDDTPHVGSIDHKSLSRALKETKAICKALGKNIKRDPYNTVPWIIEDGQMHVSGHGAVKRPITLKGRAGFNPHYLTDMPSGKAYSKGIASEPMRIDGENGRIGVIMPLRV